MGLREGGLDSLDSPGELTVGVGRVAHQGISIQGLNSEWGTLGLGELDDLVHEGWIRCVLGDS